ncbi:YheC/YheD family protein [Xylanibacillus composti]|uniref:Endospore coat-associated protein YheC n=1 Tax=Xylanibacillus composti TaxID=1572762 RepID=A0A8J4H7C0_9BACL|nr:YheC/YheD family protein [Xylanibacillus composti]MDT9724774.1 YheC/YheD family protein [Xylanibacillus composti]GIQ69873.1 endospore coat-associated protein YheC [Xylanibacillus composti]
MPRPNLGIMTLYLNDRKQIEERSLFQKMTLVGRALGLEVTVFTPEDVNFATNSIQAQIYDVRAKSWKRKRVGFPDAILDRCRYQPTNRFRQLKAFRQRYPNLLYLNRPLANKWNIYLDFVNSKRLAKYQPDTVKVTAGSEVLALLKKYPTVYLKPINGTGGRGIMRIHRLGPSSFQLAGRGMDRRILRRVQLGRSGLLAKLSRLAKTGQYLAQQGIDCTLPDGRVFDFRILIQKNARGDWEWTGGAGRIGRQGSVTSNLHGGGTAAGLDRLLRKCYRQTSKEQRVKQEMAALSFETAAYLEKRYGQLCELALDIAADRNGRIWLLEVNPKPAREVFRKIGEHHTYQTAVKRPLEYALYQINRKKG